MCLYDIFNSISAVFVSAALMRNPRHEAKLLNRRDIVMVTMVVLVTLPPLLICGSFGEIERNSPDNGASLLLSPDLLLSRDGYTLPLLAENWNARS